MTIHLHQKGIMLGDEQAFPTSTGALISSAVHAPVRQQIYKIGFCLGHSVFVPDIGILIMFGHGVNIGEAGFS